MVAFCSTPVYSSPVFTSEHIESQRQERSNPGLPFDKLIPCRGFEGVSGPYNMMVEVPTIRPDSRRTKEAVRISRLTSELHFCSLADAIVQFASLVLIHCFLLDSTFQADFVLVGSR
jgi:hypothetical protein